jgi:hypothetical protein
MLARQPQEGQRLLDVHLDPAAQLSIGRPPLGPPGRQIAPDLAEVEPIVQAAVGARGCSCGRLRVSKLIYSGRAWACSGSGSSNGAMHSGSSLSGLLA